MSYQVMKPTRRDAEDIVEGSPTSGSDQLVERVLEALEQAYMNGRVDYKLAALSKSLAKSTPSSLDQLLSHPVGKSKP